MLPLPLHSLADTLKFVYLKPNSFENDWMVSSDVLRTPRGQTSLLERRLYKVKAGNIFLSHCLYLFTICMSDIVVILAPNIYLCHV